MKIIQSYQQGARHKAKNQPCEDRTCSLSKNGVTVIALADGAGSKKYTHSADGAECVTNTISKFFCNNFDKFYEKEDTDELCSVVMTICQRALKNKSNEIDVDDIIKMSSTLLVIAVKDDKMIACHIGDGVIGKLTTKGTEVISAPDNGEFASTTYFITNPMADKHLHIIKDKTYDVISYFLMSDGTQEYVYDEVNKCFHDAARKMALFPYNSNGQEKLEQTIMDYMINADASSDDCSFICMLLADENFEPEEPPSKLNKSLISKDILEINEDLISKDESKDSNTEKNALKEEIQTTKKKKLLLIIITIFVTLAVLVTILLSQNGNKKDVTKQSATGENTALTTDVSNSRDTNNENI